MFFIIFFAYAQLGYLLFGTQVADFSTFEDSMLVSKTREYTSPLKYLLFHVALEGGTAIAEVSDCKRVER